MGGEVANVEVKNIDLPPGDERAIAKQAEASGSGAPRSFTPRGVAGLGEACPGGDSAAAEPMSLQLRYLQTLTEIAAEKNSTTIFPVPIDLIKMS